MGDGTTSLAKDFTDVDAFAGLSEGEVSEIMGGAERILYARDEVICREGDPTDFFYVLEHGHCGVHKKSGEGRDVEVATLCAKAVFGEMGLIAGTNKRTATIIANDDVVCWRVSRSFLDEKVEEGRAAVAKLILNIARTISLRLDHLNEAFASIVRKCEKAEAQSVPVAAQDLAVFKDKLYNEWSF